MTDRKENAAPVEKVLAEFEARKGNLTDFCSRTKGLIEACLKDEKIQFQFVQARVKGSEKLREKYLDPKKKYKRLDDITDLAALRIITYYDDEVDRAAKVIKREFKIDKKHSVDKRQTDPDRFGYYALNYVCWHSPKRKADVEYKKFADVCCEIQITSILRHAWSEIQHDWYDLKDAFPGDIKRRFYRMAALLEIAESEFLELRKKKSDYIKSMDVQVGAQVLEVPLDPVSLRSFAINDPIVERIDQVLSDKTGRQLSDDLGDELCKHRYKVAWLAGFRTINAVRDSLVKYDAGIIEYFERCRKLWSDAPTNKPLRKGSCIYHLAFMVLSTGSSEEILTTGTGVLAQWSIEDARLQIAAARGVMEKYSK
jgi:ppGpp synthetase/RelA/SpoT-type nucleotidyltranferase